MLNLPAILRPSRLRAERARQRYDRAYAAHRDAIDRGDTRAIGATLQPLKEALEAKIRARV